MLINREIVLKELSAYLNHQISKQEIYEWALLVASAPNFEDLAPKDPLVKAAVNAMIEMNHTGLAHVPTRKAMEYYRRCLSGELEFIPLESHRGLDKLNISDIPEDRVLAVLSNQLPLPKLKEWKYLKGTILTARLYVIIFAVCSVVVQISFIVSPGFMQIGLFIPSRWQALVDAFPHLVYAYLVLLPPERFVPTRMFVVAVPLLILGVVFYWTISWVIVAKLSLPWILFLVLLPFSAIPAILALLLVIFRKLDLK